MADENNASWLDQLLSGISKQDIGLVAIGGALGGLLQPILARFDPSQQNPDFSNWFLGPILGIAAAGITVFVLANSDTEDKPRLIFFSLLCGLAFPSVLTRAVETLDPASQAVENKAERIAATAANGKTELAATQLTSAMAQNPSTGTIEKMAEQKLEVSANAVVSNLAEKATTGDQAGASAIEKLKQIGTTARDTGYDGVALRVTEELKKIEGSKAVAADNQEDAGNAADAVIGVRFMETPPTN
jgi:hypothetical protein